MGRIRDPSRSLVHPASPTDERDPVTGRIGDPSRSLVHPASQVTSGKGRPLSPHRFAVGRAHVDVLGTSDAHLARPAREDCADLARFRAMDPVKSVQLVACARGARIRALGARGPPAGAAPARREPRSVGDDGLHRLRLFDPLRDGRLRGDLANPVRPGGVELLEGLGQVRGVPPREFGAGSTPAASSRSAYSEPTPSIRIRSAWLTHSSRGRRRSRSPASRARPASVPPRSSRARWCDAGRVQLLCEYRPDPLDIFDLHRAPLNPSTDGPMVRSDPPDPPSTRRNDSMDQSFRDEMTAGYALTNRPSSSAARCSRASSTTRPGSRSRSR